MRFLGGKCETKMRAGVKSNGINRFPAFFCGVLVGLDIGLYPRNDFVAG
jgi:hypothetical protein